MIKSGKDIFYASKLIKEGKLVAFPTETVYGLGANGLIPKAVAKIFEIKKRPSFDPLILHIADVSDLQGVFKKPIPPLVKRLADKYMPGPLTIVSERQNIIPDIVTSGLPTVAVRMPNHPVALKLIKLSGVPIAAPSANLFGRLSPTKPEHVIKQLKNVDYLIDGGQTDLGIESTIISVVDNTIEILRHGIITEYQFVTDFPDVKVISVSNSQKINAPGQLKDHYSPEKPFFLVDEIPETLASNIGLILFNSMQLPKYKECKIIYLSKTGDLLEAASNLFSALYTFENDPVIQKIYALKIEEVGIGRAIMDKLRKATYRYT